MNLNKHLLLVVLLLQGCTFAGNKTVTAERIGELRTNIVHVTISGDVAHPGLVEIERGLTRESVRKAVGGWAGISSYGMHPRSIRLKRVIDGKTNQWNIPFREMENRKWRKFLVNEGDSIYVVILF